MNCTLDFIKTENTSKIQSFIKFKEIYIISLYLDICSQTFFDFLFTYVVCHFRYTFLMLIGVDKSISSHIIEQNRFPYVLLCVLSVMLNMSVFAPDTVEEILCFKT